MALPADHRRHDPRWAWVVSLGVVLLALAFYVVVHPASSGTGQAPSPSWGGQTLAKVAVAAAAGEGDRRPTQAAWLAATRTHALAALGAPAASDAAAGSGAAAEFVVALRGHFVERSALALPGSAPQGSFLVLLVQGFDGRLTGTFVTSNDPTPALSGIGLLHPLRLFLF